MFARSRSDAKIEALRLSGNLCVVVPLSDLYWALRVLAMGQTASHDGETPEEPAAPLEEGPPFSIFASKLPRGFL